MPRYDKAWLAGDIIAGLSVWALMVPQSLGYATITGVPVQYGLYAAAVGLIVYAVCGTSRQVVTGPSSTISAVCGAAVLSVAAAGSSDAIGLVAAISVIAGLIYILLAFLKMGWISNFLAESVLTGFIFGIGIDVTVGQLDNITGSAQAGDNTWQELFSWLAHLGGTNPITLAVGVVALVLLFALKLYKPKVPGALVALVLGIAVSAYFGLSDYGVAVMGTVPRGLPVPALPDVSLITENLTLVLAAAIGVVLVGFSESLAAARQYAGKHHYEIDVDQEMLAQGLANAASGVFQGIQVDGSLSKSSLNDASGAKSEMSSLAQGGFVILTLLFLPPLFSDLPEAVLAAIIIEAVVFGLMNIAGMKRLFRLSRTEFWLAMAALLGVLTFGTLQGVLIGVGLSLLWLVWRSSYPGIPVLGKMPGSKVYHSIDNYPDSETYPGLVVIRLDGPLFFATASALLNRIRELTIDVEPPVKAVILDMESVDLVDLEGSEALHEVAKELKELDIEFRLSRTKTAIKQILEKDGVMDTIGPDQFHAHVYQAVAVVQQGAQETDTNPEASN